MDTVSRATAQRFIDDFAKSEAKKVLCLLEATLELKLLWNGVASQDFARESVPSVVKEMLPMLPNAIFATDMLLGKYIGSLLHAGSFQAAQIVFKVKKKSAESSRWGRGGSRSSLFCRMRHLSFLWEATQPSASNR